MTAKHQYLTRDEAADRVDAVRKQFEKLLYEGYDSVANLIALEMAADCLRAPVTQSRDRTQ